MTYDELRARILRATEEAFGEAYTPSQLEQAERIWDAALEAVAVKCEDKVCEGNMLRIGTAETRATWHQAAVVIRAMKGTP